MGRSNCTMRRHLGRIAPSVRSFRPAIQRAVSIFPKEGMRLSPKVLCNAKVGTHVYLCGPTSFIEEFSQQAEAFGFPKSNIHAERFTAPKPENPRPFQVSLCKSGMDVEVAAHETLLAALLRAAYGSVTRAALADAGLAKSASSKARWNIVMFT